MIKIHTKLSYILPLAWGYCPKLHPYAFLNQTRCCATNKDANNQDLQFDSTSCQFSSHRDCPAMKCDNNPSEYS